MRWHHSTSIMYKLQAIYFLVVFTLINVSCNQGNQSNNSMKLVSKTDNYKAGDCLEFKEKINDFGVIFLEENNYSDGKQYNLFPVKLDTSKTGIDKFKYGKVYLSKFIDFTKSEGRTEGFMVYHFLHQEDFKLINKFFTYIGTVSIKEKYKNSTGGTIAETYDDFRFQLNRWGQMFGQNGRLIVTSEILE